MATCPTQVPGMAMWPSSAVSVDTSWRVQWLERAEPLDHGVVTTQSATVSFICTPPFLGADSGQTTFRRHITVNKMC